MDVYRQNGNICAYLNIKTITKFDAENLSAKFTALDTANLGYGFNPIMEFLFPSLMRQILVANCSFFNLLEIKNVSK